MPSTTGGNTAVASIGEVAEMRLQQVQLCSKLNATCWCMCTKLQRCSRGMVHLDRQAHLDEMASVAQACARRGDARGTYQVVKQLGSRMSDGNDGPVFKLNGELTSTEDERQARWLEHFAAVFNGKVEPIDDVWANKYSAVDADLESWEPVHVSLAQTMLSIALLPRNKGVGIDGIPAELLQAGGVPLAARLNMLQNEVANCGEWPMLWTGGRIVNLKKKGDASVCDNSRGILLTAHMGKSFCIILDWHVQEPYSNGVPSTQFGAVKGRGTDFASHTVRSFIEYCRQSSLSYAVVFVDQVKAFDKAVREIVLGFPCGVADPMAYMESIGINKETAEWITAYVAMNGCVFEKWGVDRRITNLLKALHANSWMTYGDGKLAVGSKVGSRQGCKFGTTVFNGLYAVAQNGMHASRCQMGAVMHVPKGKLLWWEHYGSGRASHDSEGRPLQEVTKDAADHDGAGECDAGAWQAQCVGPWQHGMGVSDGGRHQHCFDPEAHAHTSV